MSGSRSGVYAALALVLFLVMANVAYGVLVATFGYDDILREPVAVILEKFAAGGAGLIMAWALFAWSALVFVFAAGLVAKALADRHRVYVGFFTVFGVASGIVQAIGLFRWVFAVPPLAAQYPAASAAEQAAITQVFQALNQYGGVALGEHIGQLLLVAWTIGVVVACWRAGGALKWTSLLGAITIPLWLVGQTELYATVIPDAPSIEATPLAFTLWMVWLLALAGALAFQKPKNTAP